MFLNDVINYSFSACFFLSLRLLSQRKTSSALLQKWICELKSRLPFSHLSPRSWNLCHCFLFASVFRSSSLSTLLHLVKYYTPIPYLCPLLVSFVHHTLAKLGWATANYLTLPYLNLTIHRFAYTAKPSLRRSLRKSKFWNTKINLKKITTTAVKGRKFGGGEPIFEVVLFF